MWSPLYNHCNFIVIQCTETAVHLKEIVSAVLLAARAEAANGEIHS